MYLLMLYSAHLRITNQKHEGRRGLMDGERVGSYMPAVALSRSPSQPHHHPSMACISSSRFGFVDMTSRAGGTTPLFVMLRHDEKSFTVATAFNY